MKKKLHIVKKIYYLLTFTLAVGLAGCQNEPVLEDQNGPMYKGLKVNYLKSDYEKITEYSLQDYQKLYSEKNSLPIGRVTEVAPVSSLKELDSIADIALSNYPNLDELSPEDVELITLSFPDLTSRELISENIEVVSEYYEALIRYDLYNLLSDLQPVSGGRTLYYTSDINSAEFWAFFWHATLISRTRDATDKTLEITNQKFLGAAMYQDKADAFRHALWNALIAKYVGDKKNEISKCTDWAKTVTDAHENGASKPSNLTNAEFDFDKGMDFHNNEQGRKYFATVAWVVKLCWLCEKDVKSPSNEVIADALYLKAVNQSYLVSNNAQLAWYPYNLVYIK